MPKTKTIRLISLPILLVVMLLNGCDDGKGLIMAVMAVAAASGVLNSVNDGGNDDQNNDSKTDEKTDGDNTDGEKTDDTESDTDTTTTEEPEYEILVQKEYNGAGDDLLTAGLGQNGLMGEAPIAADPDNPTAAEIRKATIVNQYQALLDMRTPYGYSRLYGPAIPTKFSTPTDGKVAGKEYLAYADDGSGQKNVTMMVQVPNSFDRGNPCLVAAPSPGSRGVYGAISTAGEWGLKNNCAVAYTDKGTGNGVHDLATGTVNKIDGTRAFATNVGKKANFKAEGTREMDLAAYNSIYQDRIAQKHAHSQQNPEADWGKNVIDAIEFAFYVLNLTDNLKDEFGKITTITSDNTIVIASSISTGGAASLRAAEQDSDDLIDGVVVAAPLINPRDLANEEEEITIQQGNNFSFFYKNQKKSLFDVITYHNVFQLCASANTFLGLPGRCSALQTADLLDNLEIVPQIAEAQRKLNDYGTLASTNIIADNYVGSSIYAGYANLYANAYGKFSVVDNLCGYSYAGVDDNGYPSAKSLANLADDFQKGSGIPPTDDTYLINNIGNNGQGIDFRQSADDDYYLDGAICLRELATGKNIGIGDLTADESDNYERVQEGLEKTFASGNLRGKPAIIVHGRDDALAHVNFSSRAYYALNKTAQSKNSELVYIEVKNANHFDGLNEQYDIETQVPLSYYLSQALDRMYDHLKNEVSLPVSQVIPTDPSSNNDATYLPDILNTDDVSCKITLSNRVLNIPEC